MHGQEGEERKRWRHMWPVLSPTTTLADSNIVAVDSFCKDGRNISVGDCALFQAGDSPPFIGIIRWITTGKEDNFKLGVNWLYRPADVKLGKGILLEAAPNEVFYSFHKDEIPAASLLHPCKVAFLCKGVELPSGISSFVCRRVYDIANKCLWWLTDQDYINERQEEVDHLLDKTRLEMHAAVQSGGRSPKSLNVPTSTQQLKPGSDSVHNNSTSFPSQAKSKKRGEKGDQGLEPIKRSSKTDDGDPGHFRSEPMIKAEIAKITDRGGGLINPEGVEKLVNLMQLDKADKRIDLAGRIMLADVIAATDGLECLGRFVQLRGVPVLDDWLQEAHKGKIGDGSSPKEGDKSVEELLLALLRALDKLPVNLHALQTCNVGKSVNHLRSHKNLEIQKKARSLVDTWKKRVEAEMKINDAKSGSSQGVSWPGKPGFSEVSHGGNRRTGSSEVAIKSSITQPSASKAAPSKLAHGDAVVKSTSASPGSMKMVPSMPSSVMMSSKDSPCKVAGSTATSDPLLTTLKEEKSSSSSQSQNNSQSCSSDHAKTVASAWKEDARSSTAGSVSANKTSSGASRSRKSSNGFTGSGVPGAQKETTTGKSGSVNKNASSDKVSHSGLTCQRMIDMTGDHGNSHRLIVRLSNPGRSPARSASGGSLEDPSVIGSRASSPGVVEKHDTYDRKAKGKSDACRANIATDVNTESWQSNDVKGLTGSDEGDGSPAAVLEEGHNRNNIETAKAVEGSKATCSLSGNEKGVLSESKPGKPYDGSFNSINALIESCVKYSEASTSLSVGDDLGMNLLASVAAGEMSRSGQASQVGSPGRISPGAEDSFTGNSGKVRSSCDDVAAEGLGQTDDGGDVGPAKQGASFASLQGRNELPRVGSHAVANSTGDGKNNKPSIEHMAVSEQSDQFPASGTYMHQTADVNIKPDEKPDEKSGDGCVDVYTVLTSNESSPMVAKEDGSEGEGANRLREKRKVDDITHFKPKIRVASSEENKIVDYPREKVIENSAGISDLVQGSLPDGCDDEQAPSSRKFKKEEVEESPTCPPMEVDSANSIPKHEELSINIPTEQKMLPADANHAGTLDRSVENALAPGSSNISRSDHVEERKPEKARGVEMKNYIEQSDARKTEKTGLVIENRVGANIVSLALDHNKSDATEENLERKGAPDHSPSGSAPQQESAIVPAHETEQGVRSMGSKLSSAEADEAEECASTAEESSLAKLDFDLNEGFPVDEGNQVEAVATAAPGAAVHQPSPLVFSVSPLSTGLPASITVAAAAKGPFVPPENLLKSKGELRWKGSAATSAFRPAEPRKVLEMPLSTSDAPAADASSEKQGRTPLDIDLNVPDERVLEDMTSQNSLQEMGSESGPINNRDLGQSEMLGSSPANVRSSGGLDLDLNRVDEGVENGQFSVSSCRRLEVPLLQAKSSSSGGFPNGEANVLRDFDLNNGPGLDEVGTEPAPRNQNADSNVQFLPSVAGLRMNNTELGSLSSWFPPGNSYPAVAIPSFLPENREQPYPIVATAGAQRILGSATVGSFGGDIYRGPVLSSSPAMAFSPATAFPYAGFPFGTSFPLASTSFSGGSTTYMDSSSGGGPCFPAVPSPLVGPAGAIASHFPRPYVISLPEGTAGGGAESSRKWQRQGLDLNAGPGSTDVDGRDEMLSSLPRQLSVAGPQALAEERARMYQAAGASLKRKEPEGGWDSERFSYKQPSWQ